MRTKLSAQGRTCARAHARTHALKLAESVRYDLRSAGCAELLHFENLKLDKVWDQLDLTCVHTEKCASLKTGEMHPPAVRV